MALAHDSNPVVDEEDCEEDEHGHRGKREGSQHHQTHPLKDRQANTSDRRNSLQNISFQGNVSQKHNEIPHLYQQNSEQEYAR